MKENFAVHLIMIFLLSSLMAHARLALVQQAQPDVDYSIVIVLGRAFTGTMFPLVIIGIPAVIFRYFTKERVPGFYIALWVLWLLLETFAPYEILFEAFQHDNELHALNLDVRGHAVWFVRYAA